MMAMIEAVKRAMRLPNRSEKGPPVSAPTVAPKKKSALTAPMILFV
jgi:hypothetical protein